MCCKYFPTPISLYLPVFSVLNIRKAFPISRIFRGMRGGAFWQDIIVGEKWLVSPACKFIYLIYFPLCNEDIICLYRSDSTCRNSLVEKCSFWTFLPLELVCFPVPPVPAVPTFYSPGSRYGATTNTGWSKLQTPHPAQNWKEPGPDRWWYHEV